jgi:hypothetical protein
MRTLPLLALCLAAACSSTPEAAPEDPRAALGSSFEADPLMDAPASIARAGELSIGAFLSEVGVRVQSWSAARFSGDEERTRILRQVLEFECTKRQRELIQQLETGPTRNRTLAAVALGFTNRMDVLQADLSTVPVDRGAEALSPLLNAVSDPDPEVAANALMGLGVLARPETPLAPLASALANSPEGYRRGNAAFALSAVLEAALESPEGLSEERASLAREACLRGLNDSDLGVRTQCAASLGIAGDASSIPHLGDHLDDDVALVGQAAGTALVRMARTDPTLKGRVGRLLANRLDLVRPSRRDTVIFSLVLLAGRHLGNDTEVWQDWARNLPSS